MSRVEQIGAATLYLADCREILPTLGKVDAVVTDPPYGLDGYRGTINAERGKANYTDAFEDTPEYVSSVIVPVINDLRMVCGCIALTPGNRNMSAYPQPSSFGCFYQPASVGMQGFGNADAQPIFYYGTNASRRNMGVPCSYQLTEAPEKNGHPCAKPIKAWTKLVSNITLPGQTVLDPFMGSGTTGVSCIKLGRKFVGIEIEPAYFDIACRRIEEATRQPDMFIERAPTMTQLDFINSPSSSLDQLKPEPVQGGGDGGDTYDAKDDFSKSIDECYRAIRERVAKGGPGWTPPSATGGQHERRQQLGSADQVGHGMAPLPRFSRL